MKIGVMGDKGSFSEEAAIQYAQENGIKNYEIKYLINADPVLKNLESSAIDLAIFPIQNSIGGMVDEAIYAMAEHRFEIKDTFDFDVKQNLMCKGKSAKEDITKIVSHPQALRQCQTYIRENWPEAEVVEWADTAKSAKDLNEGKLGDNVAVIAPKACAQIYGLKLLDTNIQDLKFNVTTFIAAKKIA